MNERGWRCSIGPEVKKSELQRKYTNRRRISFAERIPASVTLIRDFIHRRPMYEGATFACLATVTRYNLQHYVGNLPVFFVLRSYFSNIAIVPRSPVPVLTTVWWNVSPKPPLASSVKEGNDTKYRTGGLYMIWHVWRKASPLVRPWWGLVTWELLQYWRSKNGEPRRQADWSNSSQDRSIEISMTFTDGGPSGRTEAWTGNDSSAERWLSWKVLCPRDHRVAGLFPNLVPGGTWSFTPDCYPLSLLILVTFLRAVVEHQH